MSVVDIRLHPHRASMGDLGQGEDGGQGCGEFLPPRLAAIPGPMGLLCAEKRVSEYHRLQVARFLAEHQGAEVPHLE